VKRRDLLIVDLPGVCRGECPTTYGLIYGPAAAHSGDATLGMQSDLLCYDLHHPAPQGARKRCSLERGMQNAGPTE